MWFTLEESCRLELQPVCSEIEQKAKEEGKRDFWVKHTQEHVYAWVCCPITDLVESSTISRALIECTSCHAVEYVQKIRHEIACACEIEPLFIKGPQRAKGQEEKSHRGWSPCGERDEDSYMLHCTSELCDKWWHSVLSILQFICPVRYL